MKIKTTTQPRIYPLVAQKIIDKMIVDTVKDFNCHAICGVNWGQGVEHKENCPFNTMPNNGGSLK